MKPDLPNHRYGPAPAIAVAVHGGPGGIGSADGLARGLADVSGCGVLAPRQSKYTIAELVAELETQTDGLEAPFVLIGHSWGAWLAGLFAERHPERTKKLILVGSGPLRPGAKIDEIRRSRFSAQDAQTYDEVLRELPGCAENVRDFLLARLGEICERADTFCPAELPEEPGSAFDSLMYAKIWPEADALRRSGELEAVFARLRVPIAILHGGYDPHPADGVSTVLAEHGMAFRRVVLDRCGHTPWREKYAREEFFELLARELRETT